MSEQPNDPKETGAAQPSPPPVNDEAAFTIKKSHVRLALRIAGGLVAATIGAYLLSHLFGHNDEHHMTDNEIDDTVKASMQQQFDTDRNLSRGFLWAVRRHYSTKNWSGLQRG